MQLTSRITSITPSGEWSNGQRTFNKYRLTFANGDNLSFLAIGDFKGQVGENLTYQKNESNQTGRSLEKITTKIKALILHLKVREARKTRRPTSSDNQ